MADLHNHIGAYEAKTHFSELLAKVSTGEEITITRHGVPVARMVPMAAKTKTPQERRAAIERWRKLSKNLTLGGLKARDLIEEGRR